MDLNATATGSNNGAKICPVLATGTNITCVTDHSESPTDEKGQMWLELSYDQPGCVTYDYTQAGYKTIHLYCVFNNNWFYDNKTIYVGEGVSGVNVGDAIGNTFIPMDSTADLFISYENGSDVSVSIVINSTGTTLLAQNMTDKNMTISLDGANFGNVYGQYAVQVTLSNMVNSVERWVIIAYEEAIDGFAFTGSLAPIVHIDDQLDIRFTLTKGTDVAVVMEIGSLTLIEKCTGELRTYSMMYNVNETGTYNLTITLSNFVSVHTHPLVITAQYPVHNITIARTELMLVGDTHPMTFNMESTAQTPMGTLNADIVVFHKFTQSRQNNTISLATLVTAGPGGNQQENVDSYYTSPGYYDVNVTVYSEISREEYYWLKIVEHDVTLDITALLSVPISKSTQDIGVTINNPANSPLYKLTCSFDIDGRIQNNTFETVNYGDNATISYTYDGDGNKTLTITCSNNQKTWTDTVHVEVFTDCFESTQFFDPVYKTSSSALKVYVTDVTQVRSIHPLT